jgi:sodium/pantothenate symporter
VTLDAFSIAIIGSLLVYLVVGNLAGRRVKHLDDYFVAGRNAPTILILGTLVASVIGTNSFLGDVGMAYSGYSTPLIWSVPISVLGYILGGLFFGRYLRRAGSLTVAEFFGNRFASRRIQMLSGIFVMLGLGGYLTTVTMGAGLILPKITDLTYIQALCVVWIGYSAFTIYAGSQGVVITDTIMFLFFSVIGVIALSFILGNAGGWFGSIEALATLDTRQGIISAASYLGPGANWDTSTDIWIWTVIFSVSWGIVFAISPWQSSRYLMARDEHVVMRSACIATVVLSILWPVVYFAGTAIAIFNPDIEPNAEAMIWAALNLMPTIAGALLLAGIIAAGLSSASTFLSLTGFAITNDVLPVPDQDEQTKLRRARITVLCIGITALLIAIVAPPNVFWITTFVAQVFAACWGPVAFLCVWNKSITEAGAFWGMLAGFLSCVVLKLLSVLELLTLPVYLDPILVGAAVSLATILLVSRGGTVSEPEQAFFAKLHVAPAELSDTVAAAITMRWPKILIGWGAVCAVALIFFYARPYQAATGQLDNGEILVWSGELLLALVFGGLLSLGGLVAHWAIKRFYASGI